MIKFHSTRNINFSVHESILLVKFNIYKAT